MNTKLYFFKSISILIVGIATLVYGFNCSSDDKIQLGMSPKEVVQKIGEPDRKSILDGKLLREINGSENDIDLKKFRLVYTYEKTGIQVWFFNGKVTGVTKYGASIF